MPMVPCTTCAGSGQQYVGNDNKGLPIYGPCARCGGSGSIWVDPQR